MSIRVLILGRGCRPAGYAGGVTDMPEVATRPLPALRRGELEYRADLAARLGSHIKTAEQALVAAKSEALRASGLTVAQYAVMVALHYVPGQSAAQLARTAAVTPQTMTQILTTLERKKFITRAVSRVHGRVLTTTLTRAGTTLVREADVQARAVEERLAGSFTAHEYETLRELLARAADTLRDDSSRTPR